MLNLKKKTKRHAEFETLNDRAKTHRCRVALGFLTLRLGDKYVWLIEEVSQIVPNLPKDTKIAFATAFLAFEELSKEEQVRALLTLTLYSSLSRVYSKT